MFEGAGVGEGVRNSNTPNMQFGTRGTHIRVIGYVFHTLVKITFEAGLTYCDYCLLWKT